MKSIKLPNRYKNDVKLLYVKRDGDFYVFKPDNSFVWNYRQIMYDKNKNQIGTHPEGGPYMMNGYKINKMILDHFDKEGNLYFKKKISYKIGAMSDLHGFLPETEDVESCGIMCICGDIMPLEIQRDYTQSFIWLKENFFPWIKDLPCEKVFLIGGNHDCFLENVTIKAINRICKENLYCDKLIYLNNTLYEYDGIKIYGCPQVENLDNWAFYTESGDEYRNIPQCDILLTHMPPAIRNLGYIPKYGDFGSIELKRVLDRHKIKLWFCGHMHEGNHEIVEFNGCKLKNVSIKNDDYQPVNPITYINYEIKENN